MEMNFFPKFAWISILAAAMVAAAFPNTASAQTVQIRNIAVHSSANGTEISIETTRRVMPMTQVLTDPDRLVIDIPDAVPGPGLHELSVNQGQVKGVRAALLSSDPVMTRVVIELRSAQDFRLTPSSGSLLVTIGGGTATSAISPSARTKEPAPAPRVSETVIAPKGLDPTPARSTTGAPPLAALPVAPQPGPASGAPRSVGARPLVASKADPGSTPTVAPKVAETTPTPTRPASEARPVVTSAVAAPPARPAPAPPPSVPARPLFVPKTDPEPTLTVTPEPEETTAARPIRDSRLLTAATPQRAQIERIAVLRSGAATEIEIQTSQRIIPTTQLIADPDRLVIDFPYAVPGPQLRALPVNQGQVKGVRTGLFSTNPPVTRIVLDLKSPQQFQLFPSNRSVIVKLPGSTAIPATPSPTTVPQVAHSIAPARLPAPVPEKKVTIFFQHGLLSLTSNQGSLAEVLTEIGLATGADMSIPAGAEQEKVVASLGPGSPRDVLAQLLNGSRYNFIIMGSSADANQLARVLISVKSPGEVDIPILPSPAPQADPGPPPPDVAAAAPPSNMPQPNPPGANGQRQGDPVPPPPDAPPQQADPQPQQGDPQPAPN